MKQKVALVLASGGAKGFAHIGAIEVLEHENFEVASVAGTSIGALIGGIYAAGGLGKVKEWMYSLSRGKIFSLMDFTLSTHSLLKGNKLMDALQALVPDQRIEDLP
ncbi:MAG: patatin-like phospholipase family protein, partial [Bacteroidaceae bacterium]|nr:patatin-like phospholipase family protein [Bacteroidaceae bacterium]